MDKQRALFNFLNENQIKYVALRGYDKKSIKRKKDLDILISKEDYGKLKNLKQPTVERPVDYYVDCEDHQGIIFLTKKAISRRKFDSKRGFFVLSEGDYLRMFLLRKLLKIYWFFRKFKKD